MIVYADQNWSRLEKEYISSDCTSDAKILMAGGKVGASVKYYNFELPLMPYALPFLLHRSASYLNLDSQ